MATLAQLEVLGLSAHRATENWRNLYQSPSATRQAAYGLVNEAEAVGFKCERTAEVPGPHSPSKGFYGFDCQDPESGAFYQVRIDHAGGEPEAGATLWASVHGLDAARTRTTQGERTRKRREKVVASNAAELAGCKQQLSDAMELLTTFEAEKSTLFGQRERLTLERDALRREVDACRRAPGASGKRFQMIELE